jgi:hypothetical protein
MSQTTFVLEGHAEETDRFEGIGPYTREQFRLTAGTETLSRPLPAPVPPTQEPPRSAVAPIEIQDLDQRTYVSARWCDVGISLLVLGSGAAALFRLICLGQP